MPGVRCVPAHDTHTAGSQYVTVENARDGRWLLAGDNCYVYENFTGPRRPLHAHRPRLRQRRALRPDHGGDVAVRRRRTSPASFPSTSRSSGTRSRRAQFDDTLHVAELSLAAGEQSRVEAAAAAG